jgi:hypothetical protein
MRLIPCVGGFTAGYKKADLFYCCSFRRCFGTGVNVTPNPQPVEAGILGVPGVAAEFINAVDRGARVNTDQSANWDFSPFLPLRIDEARARLSIA